ncbi:hypothetical protein FRC04_008058 [Tulasnella sp. 424]|nr:hypothetical protein FRC04_008058 [Tulasnella sp. 424]
MATNPKKPWPNLEDDSPRSTVFIIRLAIGIPSADDFYNSRIVPPFDQVSLALFYLGFTLLSIDILVSIALCLIFLTAALHEVVSKRNWAVWRRNVRALVERNKDGLEPPDGALTQPAQGGSTLGGAKEFIIQCLKFLEQHTLFRRAANVEPAWLAALRGTIALAAIVAIFAFGALNIFILPMQQFNYPLSRKAIPPPMPYETGFADSIYGLVIDVFGAMWH